jgi:hypothetical protein
VVLLVLYLVVRIVSIDLRAQNETTLGESIQKLQNDLLSSQTRYAQIKLLAEQKMEQLSQSVNKMRNNFQVQKWILTAKVSRYRRKKKKKKENDSLKEISPLKFDADSTHGHENRHFGTAAGRNRKGVGGFDGAVRPACVETGETKQSKYSNMKTLEEKEKKRRKEERINRLLFVLYERVLRLSSNTLFLFFFFICWCELNSFKTKPQLSMA